MQCLWFGGSENIYIFTDNWHCMKICFLVISFFSFLVGPSTKSEIVLKKSNKVFQGQYCDVKLDCQFEWIKKLLGHKEAHRWVCLWALFWRGVNKAWRRLKSGWQHSCEMASRKKESHTNLSSVNLSSLLWGPYVRNLKLFQLWASPKLGLPHQVGLGTCLG